MENEIRNEVWQILKNVYGMQGDTPESDKQLKLLDTLTKYIVAKTNGGPISTNVATKAQDMFASNFGKVTKKRGRPAGAKNKV